jgi:hypothetical protein
MGKLEKNGTQMARMARIFTDKKNAICIRENPR